MLLLDDHELLREGLRLVVARMRGIRVVAAAADIDAALILAARHRPHVAIVRRAPQSPNGFAALARLAGSAAPTRVLVLATDVRGDDVVEALRAGAAGLLLTAASPEELESAISGVARGDTVLGPRVARYVAAAARGEAPSGSGADRLTDRQRAVLRLIAEGKGTKAIATALGIGIRTVETHRANLRERLEIPDVAGLVRFAIGEGLVGEPGAP